MAEAPRVRPKVMVAGREIPPDAIAAEAQNHPASSPEQAWQAAATALAIKRLLLEEADRLGIAVETVHDRNGVELAPDDARIETLLAAEVHAPNAGPSETRRFYEQRREYFQSPTLIEAEHILLAAAPADKAARGKAYEMASAILADVQKRPDLFADFARQHSACSSKDTGGNLGQIGPGQTVEPFEKALFALKEGAFCEAPVETRFGYHVIRAGRRSEGQLLPFEVVEEKIAGYLEEASYRRAVSQFLTILAGRHGVEGVVFGHTDGPLVQ